MNSNCTVSFVKIVAVVTHDFLSFFYHPAHSVFTATVSKTLDTTRITFLEGPLFCLMTVYPWLLQMMISTFVLVPGTLISLCHNLRVHYKQHVPRMSDITTANVVNINSSISLPSHLLFSSHS